MRRDRCWRNSWLADPENVGGTGSDTPSPNPAALAQFDCPLRTRRDQPPSPNPAALAPFDCPLRTCRDPSALAQFDRPLRTCRVQRRQPPSPDPDPAALAQFDCPRRTRRPRHPSPNLTVLYGRAASKDASRHPRTRQLLPNLTALAPGAQFDRPLRTCREPTDVPGGPSSKPFIAEWRPRHVRQGRSNGASVRCGRETV